MRYSEHIAALRRIPVYLVDATGDPVTGATPLTLQISKSGAPWSTGAGMWTEIEDGEGLYYYEATRAETTSRSFLLARITATGARTYVYAVDIGDRITADASAAARRLPVFLVDASGDGVPDLTPDVLVSLNGAAVGAAAGSLVQIGDGAYYYELGASELVEGFGALRIDDPSATLYVYSWDVRPAVVRLADDVPTPIPDSLSVGGTIPVIDHVTGALARLPSMYRGGGD